MEETGKANMRLAEQLIVEPMDKMFETCYKSLLAFATSDSCDNATRDEIAKHYALLYDAWLVTQNLDVSHNDSETRLREGYMRNNRIMNCCSTLEEPSS